MVPVPEERLEQDINALYDSVDLITRLVSEGVHSEEIHDTISRNTRHIRIMLEADHIKNSDYHLGVFEDSAAEGEQFISQ